MGAFDDLIPETPKTEFSDLIPAPDSAAIADEQAEIMEGFGEEGLGPVGADQDIDVDDLIDAGIISPENIKGRTLGEIAADPETQRAVLEIGGMTIGSIFVPQLTLPLAMSRFPRAVKLIKQLAGAGAGGFAGSIAAEARDPTEKPVETATEAAVFGLAAEGVGQLAVKVGKEVVAPFKDKLVEGAKEAIAAITKRGGVVTPGRVTESRGLQVVESMSEASILGGGQIKDTTRRATKIAQQMADDFMEGFSRQATREETSLLVQDTIRAGAEAWKTAAGKLYGRVDDLAEKVIVDITASKKLAQQILEKSEKGLKSPDVKKVVSDILNKPNSVPFEQAQALRSDLLGVSRLKEKGLVAGKGEAAAKRLASSFKSDMTIAGETLNPEALAAWREASDFWRMGSKTFDDRVIKSLATRSPDGLFAAAIKHNNPDTVHRIRSIIQDSKTWDKIKGQFIQDIFEKSTNEVGEISGKQLLKQVKKWREGGSLAALLSKSEAAELQKVAQTLRLVESATTTEKVGSVAIQLLQVGAAGTIFSLNENRAEGTGLAAAIIFGPAVMAKALTNKSFSKWLTIGLRSPPGSKQGTLAATRLITLLRKEGAEDAPTGEE